MTRETGVGCTLIKMKPNDELNETIQNEGKQLTITELRTFKGLENLTDEEAQETINTLVSFSVIIYSIFNSKILKNEKSFDEV